MPDIERSSRGPCPDCGGEGEVQFGYEPDQCPARGGEGDVCVSCVSEAEELRVVGPDHRNTADYTGNRPHCPDCDAAWPPNGTMETS